MRFYLSGVDQIRHICRLREHLSYIAHGMHVFIDVFKIVREQSVAKSVEIQANTHARDMSHRFPLGPFVFLQDIIPAFPSVMYWSPICESLIWYNESIRISPQVTESLLCRFANRVIV